MKAYYNEFDPGAAAWLRQLIADGLITPGDVDDRSITDVQPADLVGYDRVHFFAGIGGWDLALTLAGWGDRPVWTGSCPCQPFSAAGKRRGVADERHLWPEFFRLIRECRPECVFGEQVSGALGWLDLVSADLEGEGYACGAVIVGAHSVGAPHIRQRLYWVADAQAARWGAGRSGEAGDGRDAPRLKPAGLRDALGLADAERGSAERRGHDVGAAAGRAQGEARERERLRDDTGAGVELGRLANPDGREPRHGGLQPRGQHGLEPQDGGACERLADAVLAGRAEGRAVAGGGPAAGGGESGGVGHAHDAGPQGHGRPLRLDDSAGWQGAERHHPQASPWADLQWLPCRDGKARPTQPVFQFVVDGLFAGMGDVWGACLHQAREAIDGTTGIGSQGEALRQVWESVAAQAIQRRTGGSDSLLPEEVLLIALCEHARRLGAELDGAAPDLGTLQGATLRVLRGDAAESPVPARPSPQWRLEGSPAGKLADAVHTLPPAWRSWREAVPMIAGHPLAHGMKGRVGLLRGAGNAIVPAVAAAFIEAYRDARGE